MALEDFYFEVVHLESWFQRFQELEDVLLDGTEREKNLAFQELRVRGADEDRITELATRRERSEAQQQAINDLKSLAINATRPI